MHQQLVASKLAFSGEKTYTSRQAEIERVLALADHLSLPDRALVRGVYQQGMKVGEMAQAMGQTPHSARCRLRRLLERLSRPIFKFVIQNRHNWPERRRAVAEAIVLRGQRQRETAAALQISVHHVRQELERVRTLCQQQQEDRNMRRVERNGIADDMYAN